MSCIISVSTRYDSTNDEDRLAWNLIYPINRPLTPTNMLIRELLTELFKFFFSSTNYQKNKLWIETGLVSSIEIINETLREKVTGNSSQVKARFHVFFLTKQRFSDSKSNDHRRARGHERAVRQAGRQAGSRVREQRAPRMNVNK